MSPYTREVRGEGDAIRQRLMNALMGVDQAIQQEKRSNAQKDQQSH
jgi:hypothetical protein